MGVSRCLSGGVSETGQALLPAASDLLELSRQNFRRVDCTPAIQVVVGESDHGCAITAGFGEEQVGRAALHRTVVEETAVIGVFLEGRAELRPRGQDICDGVTTIAGFADLRQRLLDGGGRLGLEAPRQFQIGRWVAAHAPAHHQPVDIRLCEVAVVPGDEVHHGQARHRRQFPRAIGLNLGDGLEASLLGESPMLCGARAGTDRRDRILPNAAADAAAGDGLAPFADAHHVDVVGQGVDDLRGPVRAAPAGGGSVGPAPVVGDDLGLRIACPDPFCDCAIDLRNHLGSRPLRAAGTTLRGSAVAIAVREVLRAGDGEDAA